MIVPPAPTVAVPLFGAPVIVTLPLFRLLCGSVSFDNTVNVVVVSSFAVTTSGLAIGVQSSVTTATVACAEVQPFSVAVTVYVPPIAAVALAMVGFCVVDVYEAGPDQL